MNMKLSFIAVFALLLLAFATAQSVPRDNPIFTCTPNVVVHQTLVANSSADSLDATSVIGDLNKGGFWPLFTQLIIPKENYNNLPNAHSLPAGLYYVTLESGSWSRWNNESHDSSVWGGGPGLVWEASFNIAYNAYAPNNLSNSPNNLVNVKLAKAFYATAQEAEAAGKNMSWIVNTTGGDMYFWLDDEQPSTVDRGSVNIVMYPCTFSQPSIPDSFFLDDSDYTKPVNKTVISIPAFIPADSNENTINYFGQDNGNATVMNDYTSKSFSPGIAYAVLALLVILIIILIAAIVTL